VKLVVNKVALGQTFSEYSSFPHHIISSVLHTYLTWTNERSPGTSKNNDFSKNGECWIESTFTFLRLQMIKGSANVIRWSKCRSFPAVRLAR